MRMRTGCILVLLCVSRFAIAGGAVDPLAQPTQAQGREHLHRGRAAASLQRYDEAIKEFEAGVGVSYELACWYWNLGQVHRMAGHPRDAMNAYERFISLVGDRPAAADRVKLARQFIEDARRALADAQRPPTELDDKPPPRQPSTPESPATIEAAPLRAVSPAPAPAPRWYEDRLGWSLVAGAAVLGGVGVGLHVSAGGLRSDAQDANSQREHLDLLDRADGRSLTGTLFLLGAGAVATGAAVRLILVPEVMHVEARPGYVGVRASF